MQIPKRFLTPKTILPTGGLLVTTAIYSNEEEAVKPEGLDKLKTLKITKQLNFHPPQNPIILCHGLSGFSTLQLIPSFQQLKAFVEKATNSSTPLSQTPIEAALCVDYWHGIKQKLESSGCKVFIAKVAPYGSISQRAKVLNVYINEICKENDFKEVNLVAHSMGGLDCRYLISAIPDEAKQYKVCSLTTLSTPHHGSVVADYLLHNLKLDKFVSNDGVVRIIPPAFGQLTTDYLKGFNERHPPDENVAYFSFGAYFWPKWYNFFYLTWRIVFFSSTVLEDRMSDGLVSINSSKYGHYLGTLKNVDHLTLINWLDITKKLKVNSWFSDNDVLHNTNSQDLAQKDDNDDFDILDLYVKICDDLGKRGF